MKKCYLLLQALLCLLLFNQTLNAQWSLAYTYHYRDANSVFILNQQTAVIVGGNEKNDSIESIFNTTNRDTSWNFAMDSLKPWLSGVAFASTGVGVAVGEDGRVLR